MLVIDGVKYRLLTPKDEEKEFHPMTKDHSKEIFGENSLYFDVKHKLISRSGIGSIPDAYVISLSKPYQWYIVENELASHRVYEHIVPQISKFISAIENLRSQRDIRDVLYNEITQDKVLKASVEKMIHPEEIHRFLSSLVSRPPKIAIIIDEVTDEVREASKALDKLGETEVVEFRTFVREDAQNVHAHLFEPIYVLERISEKGKISAAARKAWETRKKELPPHYKSYETMLAWVDENTRNIAKQLELDVRRKMKDVTDLPRGRCLCFYKGKPSTKSIFAAFLLTKKYLKVRIRTEPRTLRDPNRLLKEKLYRGWFFKQGQEREFNITNKEQIDYAMELIKQSYETTLPKENKTSLSIIDLRFLRTDSKEYIEVKCKNIGTAKLTIVKAIVSTVAGGIAYVIEDGSINPNEQKLIRIRAGWAPGYEYAIELVTASGDKFPYTGISPR